MAEKKVDILQGFRMVKDCPMAFSPIIAAQDCIQRSRQYIALAGQNGLDARLAEDLCRSGLVLAVSALDAYMHWLIYEQISELRKSGDLPKSFGKLDITFTQFAEFADSVLVARKNGKVSRPWVKVKNAMQERLLRETFQSYEQVGNALSLAGVVKGWSRTATELGQTTKEIQRRLNSLVHRRNQIVHEGDLTRASRPRAVKHNSIDQVTVTADIDWIESLINAIERVVLAGNP